MDVKNAVITYSVTDQVIAELKDQYSNPGEITTITNRTRMATSVKIIRDLRLQVESKRKELKSDSLEYGRKVDSAARTIREQLEGIEDPMKERIKTFDDKKQAEKDERDRIERERVEGIQKRIREFIPENYMLMDSTTLKKHADALMGIEISPDDYLEFTELALEKWETALGAIMKQFAERNTWEKEQDAGKKQLESIREERGVLEQDKKTAANDYFHQVAKNIQHNQNKVEAPLLAHAEEQGKSTTEEAMTSLVNREKEILRNYWRMISGIELPDFLTPFGKNTYTEIQHLLSGLKALCCFEEEEGAE